MQSSQPTSKAHYAAHSTMPRFASESPSAYQSRPMSAQASQRMPDDVQRLLFSTPASAKQYGVEDDLDLGQPLAQIHQCYVLAQTPDGIILVDQHAAHERMTFEKLKVQLAGGDVVAQMMLTPERLELDSESLAWVADHPDALSAFAVKLEVLDDAVLIQSVPAMLGKDSPAELVAELIESCMLLGVEAEAGNTGLGRILERWLGNRACKGSIKAGRTLSHEEQVNLLREMEKTPNIAQCNHGRPTYIRLSLYDLDKLFGRKE
jgi:DNA mismatch repair protein MutL